MQVVRRPRGRRPPPVGRRASAATRCCSSRTAPTYAWQDDTLVMPDHRGHRLGAALKAVNYADLPGDVRVVHTWTAPSNAAMHHTNTALGFRVVEHMHEMEAASELAPDRVPPEGR